jgi:hypothetical protein
VVARRDGGEAGREEVLVKWRGLEYDKATWEPREGLQGEEVQELEKVGRLRWARRQCSAPWMWGAGWAACVRVGGWLCGDGKGVR